MNAKNANLFLCAFGTPHKMLIEITEFEANYTHHKISH